MKITDTEFERQEKLYLDNIIWLWSEYDHMANIYQYGDERLFDIYQAIQTAYEDYYVYFGHHCTYQPKLSYLP